MKVVFTGGGTGGHFYPIIAVAEALNELVDQEKLAEAKFYYFGTKAYDEKALFEAGLEFQEISAGKLRIYPSLKNLTDPFKTIVGIFQALSALFRIFPDIVFSKGGYSSFPTLVAARILRIPVMIHESDSAPGRVNRWAGKFAKRIAISYDEAGEYFPADRTAHTGQPVRKSVMKPIEHGSREYLKLEEDIPTLFILGGSQGAQLINNAIVNSLPKLIDKYQIIHQTGTANLTEMEIRSSALIGDHPRKNRYRPFAFLNPLAMSMSAAIADLVISRAGSTIFEIAAWGVPSIIVPFKKSNADHAKKNAFNYARAGACVVIEEDNFGSKMLLSEIDRLMNDTKELEEMSKAAQAFFDPGAADLIAKELVAIGLSHEQ